MTSRKFEYASVDTKENRSLLEALNEYGSQGWELVNLEWLSLDDGIRLRPGGYRLLLKREILPEPSPASPREEGR